MRDASLLEYVSHKTAFGGSSERSAVVILEDESLTQDLAVLPEYFHQTLTARSSGELSDTLKAATNVRLALYVTQNPSCEIKDILSKYVKQNLDLWVLCLVIGSFEAKETKSKRKIVFIGQIGVVTNALPEDKQRNFRYFLNDITDRYGNYQMIDTD